MKFRNITKKELKEVMERLSLLFGGTAIKLKVNGRYYDSEYLKPNSQAGWWGNFINSFMLRVDKKIGETKQDYLIAYCNIYYNHPGGSQNGLEFYLLKHKDGDLWKLFTSYQGIANYIKIPEQF